MTALRIAADLTLPLEAVTQTFAVLARKGSGKTYTAAVMAEEMLEAGQPIVAVDPTGAWWGLRSSADGKKDGYPVVVFGGDRADLPLNPLAGEVVAQAVVAKRFPAVLDLSTLRKGEVQRFLTAFLETLYRTNREPLHLFIDEADDVCPQRPFGDEARLVGAVEDVVKRGRKKGIGCTLITQRPADLSKQVLTQCEVLFALNISHPKDIAPVEEWVRVHADDKQARQMIADLPTLPKGEGWIWSPAWLEVFKRVKVRKRRTFDSGATPAVGQTRAEPKRLAAVDVSALGEQMAALAEEVKANDPAALKRRVAELEKQLKERPATELKVERVEVPALTADQERLISAAVDEFRTAAEKVGHALNLVSQAKAAVQTTPPPSPPKVVHPTAPKPKPAAGPANPEVGKGGLRRILIALAQRPGLTNRQIGLRAGLSSQSGTFSTYLGRARSAGWVCDEGERRFVTDDGLVALGEYDPLPEGEALLAHWLNELGGGASRMLRAYADAYPDGLTNEQCGERAGISAASGTFSTYLGRLRGLELVEGRGVVRASSELFD